MPFEPSDQMKILQARVEAFMEAFIDPNEGQHGEQAESLGPRAILPVVEEL